MLCPVCIANAALAVAGATTSGGAAAMALRILRRERRVKGKGDGRSPNFLPRRTKDRRDRSAGSERYRQIQGEEK